MANRNKNQRSKDNKRTSAVVQDQRDTRTTSRSNRNASQYDKSVAYNDPSWRQYNSLLTDTTTAFSLNVLAGKPLSVDGSTVAKQNTYSLVNDGYPMDIMKIAINPSLGRSFNASSAINKAMLELYTTLSAQNSKTTNYTPGDLGMLFGALGSVASLSSFIRRTFGLLRVASPVNWAYPRAIINASGVWYDDLKSRVAEYRNRYNLLCVDFDSISFPTGFDYFKACEALYSNVFFDHTSAKAQTILTVPHSVWVYSELASEDYAALKTAELGLSTTSMIKMETLLDVLEEQIQAIRTSTLFNYVYPDVLKYTDMNPSKVWKMTALDPTYAVVPGYNEEFMLQFGNMEVLGAPTSKAISTIENGPVLFTPENDVYNVHGSGLITYVPGWDLTRTGSYGVVNTFVDHVYNFHVDNPSAVDRVVASRFKPAYVASAMRFDPTTQAAKAYAEFNPCDAYIVSVNVYTSVEYGSIAVKDSTGAATPPSITQILNWTDIVSGYSASCNWFHGLPVTPCGIPTVTWDEGLYKWIVSINALGYKGEADILATLGEQDLDTINDMSMLALTTFHS